MWLTKNKLYLGFSRINRNDRKFEMKYRASQPVRLEGDYNITGKVMVLPIHGHGKSRFVLSKYLEDINNEFLDINLRKKEYEE